MVSINLTLIQTFYYLGRTGSYSGAGQELGLSHPAVANQVRKLERIVGGPLVEAERGARKLRFTSRGKQLYALIRPDLDIMLSRLDALLQKQSPLLRMGMSQGAFHHLIERVIPDFRVLYPEVSFVIFERDTALADLVRQGSIDVFLADRHFGDPFVEQQLLGHYELCIAYPSKWTDAPDPKHLREWAVRHPFVSFEPGQTLRDIAVDYLNRDGIRVEPVIATSSTANVKQCIAKGLGYGVLPRWAIEPDDQHISIAALPDLAPAPAYFGAARVLHGSPMLGDLFRLCQEQFLRAASPST